MDHIDQDTATSTAMVLERILQEEADSDHEYILSNALDRLEELYGSPLSVDVDCLDSDDVEVAHTFLMNNEDATLRHAYGFVDTNARYVNGCLPSFRDWLVAYVKDGRVIEQRVYDHDDEIPRDPEIDGVQHTCDRVEHGDGEVVVYLA